MCVRAQALSHVQLFPIPWTVARQSLSTKSMATGLLVLLPSIAAVYFLALQRSVH